MNDRPDHTRPGTGLSRRDFLRGSGAAAASVLGPLPGLTPADAADKANVVGLGPTAVALQLTVDGTKLESKIEPRVTLLDALRDYLDVTACKRVCDRGSCGACTVLLDGKPVYSCTMLALEARGKDIKTAAALDHAGKLGKVPAAFVAADALQCGFCTPGFVVAMDAVLKKNPGATPGDVEAGLAGNVCRCGAYEQMRHAIAALCEKKKGG